MALPTLDDYFMYGVLKGMLNMKKSLGILLAVIMLFSFAYAEGAAFTLTAPAGAPAVAVALLAEKNPDAFTFIAADTIAAAFAKNESDLIIAPINAGAKLYKAGKSTYRLAAVVTWGNLVFASRRSGFKPEDIQDQTVTLFGENTINSSVALYALQLNGIVPANVEYLAGAAETQQLLLQDDQSIVLTAEPAVTAAKIKNDAVVSWPVNDLLGDASGFRGFAQAGLFVRAETAEKNQKELAEYLEQIRGAAQSCETDTEAVANAAAALEILPNVKVALAAIPNCGIRYVSASEARDAVEYAAGIDLAQFGGSLPEDGFYYASQE